MRILFLGNNLNTIGVRCLEALVIEGSHHVTVWIHDAARDRGLWTFRGFLGRYGFAFLLGKGWSYFASAVRLYARRLGLRPRSDGSLRELSDHYEIPFQHIGSINDPDSADAARGLSPDLMLIAGFSQILKPEIISIPKLGVVNVHPSLLPRYRGPNPFYWVLRNAEVKTGVTIHYVDAGIDSGDIILQEELTILPGDTERSLQKRCIPLATNLVVEAMRLISQGEAPRIKQDETEASYYSFAPRGRHL